MLSSYRGKNRHDAMQQHMNNMQHLHFFHALDMQVMTMSCDFVT